MTLTGTRDPVTTLRTSDNASDPAVSWKVKCLNCGAALAGPFCAECGQRALPPHPDVRELVGDAFSEFSGWDGKFSETLRTLILKPGELTRQWLEGRRVHYISPLRLYLTASLVFFLLQSSAPNFGRNAGPIFSITPDGGGKPVAASGGAAGPLSKPDQAAAAMQKALRSRKPLTQAARDSVKLLIAKAPWIMRPMMTKSVDDPSAFLDAIKRNVPRMLFALLPLYAAILALFYRRRHYPEHLYFAIHLHSFVFIALLVNELAKYTRVQAISGVAGVVSMCWIVGYSLTALRRVYGGSWGATIGKGIAIMMLYGIIALPAMLLVVLLASF